ncbi:MAG: hypothetical protein WA891_08815 [Acidobacteriaceae bacterium]
MPSSRMLASLAQTLETDSALETTWKIANAIYDRHFPERAIRLPELQARAAEKLRRAA